MNTPRRSSPPLRSPEQRRGDPETMEGPAVGGTLKETERVQQGPGGPGRGPMGGGMIGQKADTFWPSLKRLLARLRPERAKTYAVLVLTIVSVVLTAVGPWVLGRATDLIFAGLIGRDVLASGGTQEQAIEALRDRGEVVRLLQADLVERHVERPLEAPLDVVGRLPVPGQEDHARGWRCSRRSGPRRRRRDPGR